MYPVTQGSFPLCLRLCGVFLVAPDGKESWTSMNYMTTWDIGAFSGHMAQLLPQSALTTGSWYYHTSPVPFPSYKGKLKEVCGFLFLMNVSIQFAGSHLLTQKGQEKPEPFWPGPVPRQSLCWTTLRESDFLKNKYWVLWVLVIFNCTQSIFNKMEIIWNETKALHSMSPWKVNIIISSPPTGTGLEENRCFSRGA